MAWPCTKTHRCAGSVENEASIRKDAAKSRLRKNDGVFTGWTLWTRRYDLEYDYYDEICVGTIAFCPFCGAKMDGGDNK